MHRNRPSYWALLVAAGVALSPGTLLALSSGEARERAESAIRSVEAKASSAQTPPKLRTEPPTIAERIAAGEMLMRIKDYDGAVDELNKVVELSRQGKVPETSKVDGMFLLGESYFRSDQFLSARRQFRQILDGAPKSPYDGYAGRALSRLVDIAIRTDTLGDLDAVFARMAQLGQDSTGSLGYARAKAYFAKGDFASAISSVSGVPANSNYAYQAQYLLGAIKAKQVALAHAGATDEKPPPVNRFAEAISQFRRVTQMPAKTTEQKHVVDLAWLAIGRLYYESEQYLDAAESYTHVDRRSPEFSVMLYELAWVYVRLGDYLRAQRALEVLAVTDPDTLDLADGALLRGDLMLRSGQFEKSLVAYEEVKQEYDPVRQQVQAFLDSTSDPAVYYDKLTGDEFAEGYGGLPPMVIEWARQEAKDERVFGVIDDVTRSRNLVKRSRSLAAKLSAVLDSPTRAKAFPKLKQALEQTIGLINKLGHARRSLALGMDDVAGSTGGELATVRQERRQLMKRMGHLPVTDGDFSRREAAGERQWNRVSQKLQGLVVQADRLQAMVNALRKVLDDADKYNVSVSGANRERFREQIEASERDLATIRERMQQYRDGIEMGRVQIGFGDQRYLEDDRVHGRFRQVFAREVALAAQAGGSEAEYAREIQPLLARADEVEARLTTGRKALEAKAGSGALELQKLVRAESSNVEGYSEKLDALDQQARLLVGEMAMKNFRLVRDRLKSVVLRADVGIVQQAWELREEQRRRVRNLQRERAQEEQTLNEELQEVLDDAEVGQ